jgi:hypothetical protein
MKLNAEVKILPRRLSYVAAAISLPQRQMDNDAKFTAADEAKRRGKNSTAAFVICCRDNKFTAARDG